MKKGHIFFITWVAGSWKWTMIKLLLDDKSLDFKLILSYKTREPRYEEVVWVDYHHLSFKEFQKAIDAWEFFEYNFIHNQDYYWTKEKDLLDWLDSWDIMIKELDILIWEKVLSENKIDKKNLTFIFLDIPLDLVKERMKSRWDDINSEDYKNRIKSAKKEKKYTHLADYVIDASVSKEEVYKEIKDIIIKHSK